MNVVYYWYHHQMDPKDRDAVQKCLDRKNYNKFCKWYDRLRERGERRGLVYLPETAAVFDESGAEVGEVNILDREAFSQITRSESECG